MEDGGVVESWETAEAGEIGRGLDAAREAHAAEQRRAAAALARQAEELRIAEAAATAAAAAEPPRPVKILQRPESGGNLASQAKEEAKDEPAKVVVSLEERERRYAQARLRIFGTLDEGDPNPQGEEGAQPLAASPANAAAAAAAKKKKKGKKGGGSPGNGGGALRDNSPPTAAVSSSQGHLSPPSSTRVAPSLPRRPPSPDIPPDFVRSAPMPGVPTFQGRPLTRPPYKPPAPAVLMPKVDLTRPANGPAKVERGSAGFRPQPPPLIPRAPPPPPANPAAPAAFAGDPSYASYGRPPPPLYAHGGHVQAPPPPPSGAAYAQHQHQQPFLRAPATGPTLAFALPPSQQPPPTQQAPPPRHQQPPSNFY